MKTISDFSAKTLAGEDKKLSDLSGQVILIVNTASKCGFTPQYAGLEQLHQQFHHQGLAVVGFPCNQFGGQEPADEAGIAEFCQLNYGVSFLMMEKIEVNGDNAHPIYQWLTAEKPGILGTEMIKWNFTKFLIGRDGQVVARYAPQTKPESIADDIAKELAK